jgi:phosphoglycolate phosphatase
VLFDWDNTLIDSWDCIHAALNVTFEAMGLPAWSLEDTLAKVRRSLRESFPLLFGERWEEARAVYYQHFSAHHLEHLRPLAGARELLETLSGQGVYLAVVSNKTGRFLRAEAAALGWEGYFGRLVGAADAAVDKPDPEPVRLALEPLGLVPGRFRADEAWFIGDADVDMECAHATGCLPILVGGGADAGFERFPPAIRVADCGALAALVRRIGPFDRL